LVWSGEAGRQNLTEFLSSAFSRGGLADPPLRASNEGSPSILLPVVDGTDARRGLSISFVVLLHVWREEFRGDFAEGAKKLRR